MRLLFAFCVCAVLLSSCAPMALFAQGGGRAYSAFDKSFGTYVAHDRVNALCLSPKMRLAIWEFEGRFGRKVVMNSGFRDREYNRRVGGADNSFHTRCMAADFFIPGVPKSELIVFARSKHVVGGLGCYPNQDFIHVDVRNRPRNSRGPVTFSGC